ncbi:hypothetical protein [Benzoatithermus flavus]|uniref:Uncharacterized protein n=1 Tax=Benzoatithermus flavus TaxID=3108223 RepID=A0ABU8XYA4_9PROT
MTTLPSPRAPAQAAAARTNGARSHRPAEGKARAAPNATRHGLGATRFYLLPDEDAAEYQAFRDDLLAALHPRDAAERHAAERAIQAMWRQSRADRLEAEILGELFAAKEIQDQAEAQAARQAAFRAMSTLLRYRGRIERERERALAAFHALRRQLPPAAPPPASTNGPGAASPAAPAPAAASGTNEPAAPASPDLRRLAPLRNGTSGPAPVRPLNRHQRRRLAALERQAQRKAA